MNDAPTKPQASLDLGEEQASSLSTPTFVVDVALPIPVRHTFTYRVDGSMQSQALRGARVYIPFGKREALGVILRAHEVSLTREQLARTKSIIGVEDGDVLFEESTLRTLERAADYYLSPIGEVLKGATPAIASQELRAWKKNSVGKQPKNAAKKKVEIVSLRVQTDALREPRGKHQTRILAVMRERPSIDARELMKLVGCQRAVLSKMETLLWLEIRTTYVWDDPFFSEPVERDVAPTLTAEQSLALSHLHDSIAARAFASHLVLGATGSGKTEVYLGAIAATLVQGRGALLLLPEIGLTPQLIRKVRARFGDDIAVLHSGLGDRDRALHWHKLRSGQVRLAVGARSAVFAPVRDLGLIVVDEEHDSSYKQEEGFRYHGRDVALLRAQECSAVVVLGSATPSLETFHLAQTGKHSLLRMRSRPTARPLPRVDIVDLARMGQGPSREPLLSAPLHRAIERALAASEQTILFLNRRGFAPSLRCETCGAIQSCPACSVSLTEHRSSRTPAASPRCCERSGSRRWP